MALEAQLHETARLLIARYRRDARADAEHRADVLHHQGEPRAAITWRLVMRTIAVMAEDAAAASRPAGAALRPESD